MITLSILKSVPAKAASSCSWHRSIRRSTISESKSIQAYFFAALQAAITVWQDCSESLINTYFAEGEIDKIYLNFSDPWPKERHARRRLPSSEYLRRYDLILVQGGTIEFKTDNRGLFDFAVEEVGQSVFEIAQITYDLHNDPVMSIGNIMTEYEEKFSKKGNKICKYILRRRA